MAKVTYLLGAGASCKAVPMMADLPKKIEELRKNHILKTQLLDLFYYEFKERQTIDTAFKRVFITGKGLMSYDSLKTVYSILFPLFSFDKFEHKRDPRYDHLLAVIFRDGGIPNDFTFLNWNYDLQLELAFQEYCNPHKKIRSIISDNKDQIVHLNGYSDRLNFSQTDKELLSKLIIEKLKEVYEMSSYYVTDVWESLEESIKKLNEELFDSGFVSTFLSRLYELIMAAGQNFVVDTDLEVINSMIYGFVNALLESIESNKITHSDLHFSWERSIGDIISDDTVQSIQESKYLVVIGYSFPYFNRVIDNEILRMMTNLEVIYYQDPIDRTNTLVEALPGVSAKIKWVGDDISQFFIPPELSLF